MSFFDPQVKCCTYLPELPNFLVGRILADEDPALAVGRATVEKRLQAGVAVTPLGLDRTPFYDLLYQHADTAFGRSHTLRCPHYIEEGGLCGIWQHRNSVCATWFCKHVRGAMGFRFWKEEEFYQQCAHLVNRLTWQEVTTIGGPETHIVTRLTREVYTRADARFIGLPRIARHSRKPPPIANAPIENLATSTAPASRNRSTTVAS